MDGDADALSESMGQVGAGNLLAAIIVRLVQPKAAPGAPKSAGAPAEESVGADKSACSKTSPKGGLSNLEVRNWYEEQLSKIDDSGPATEENAKRISEARNALRQQARDMMADRAAAEQLERDQPIKPFSYYVDKYSKQGYTGEALSRKIMESGKKPNKGISDKVRGK